MGLTLADSYYLKAKAASQGFHSDWEEVCESLNYALSYDSQHCASLCLLGEVYARYLSMPTEAYACFDKVIAIDTSYHMVYYVYIQYLIWNYELERAGKLIAFAETIPNSSKAQLRWLSSYIEEVRGNYDASLDALKQAKKHCYNDHYFDFLEDEHKRIKKKMKLEKPVKPKKTKKSSKK